MKNSTDVLEKAVEQTSWMDDYNDIHHYVCCVDDNVLLCGADGSGLQFVEDNSQPICADCGVADMRDLCPKWGVCIET